MLRNEFFMILASALLLFVLALVSFQFWVFFFSVLVGWVIADGLSGFFTRRGRGIGQTMGSNRMQPRGVVYLAFFVGIIVATEISSLMLNGVPNLVADIGKYYLLPLSFFASLVVWVDMRVRLYRR
jgi:hypothetical protein